VEASGSNKVSPTRDCTEDQQLLLFDMSAWGTAVKYETKLITKQSKTRRSPSEQILRSYVFNACPRFQCAAGGKAMPSIIFTVSKVAQNINSIWNFKIKSLPRKIHFWKVVTEQYQILETQTF
jgi:hypothetical protein